MMAISGTDSMSLAGLPEVLRGLSLEALHSLARYQRALAFTSGLAVTSPDGLHRKPISPVLTPVIVEVAELARRQMIATQVAQACALTARWLLGGPRAHVLLDAMAPIEREIVAATWQRLSVVPNIRVDFFLDHQHHPWALEVNATIPAMQAYSDIAAASWIRAVGEAKDLGEAHIQSLLERNGSNRGALVSALLSAYWAKGGESSTPTIGLCARRHDAQFTELQAVAEYMRGQGCPAFIVHPDELYLRGDEMFGCGQRIDLLYRHLFARYLQPDMVLTHILRHPDKFQVFNPVNAQLEIKRTLAEASAAASDPTVAAAIGLTPEHIDALLNHVPWTRHLSPGPTIGPDGEPLADLLTFAQQHPERFVIKRSWDYGGKAVFVGAAWEEVGTQSRVRDYNGGDPLSWPALVQKCASDSLGGGFVIQAHIDTATIPMTQADPEGELSTHSMFVDFSAYTSLGLDMPAWGGVCRASSASIVNIVGGGGVAALLRADVAADLVV